MVCFALLILSSLALEDSEDLELDDSPPYGDPYGENPYEDPYEHHLHHHKWSKTGKRLHHHRRRDPYGYYEDSDYMEDFYYYMLDENNKPMCGPNAELINKKCYCKKEYPVGNPRTYPGCYRCNEKCSKYGHCVHPGNCECQFGYDGNGTWCSQTKPSVKAISNVVDGKVKVTTGFESDDQMHEGFCKFGSIIVQAETACNDYLICPVPSRIPDQVIFQVSYNGEQWSDDSIVFQNDENISPPSPVTSSKALAIIFVISMIVLVILLYNSKPVQIEEAEPFIKQRPRPRNSEVRKRNV